jgi:nucleoside-diphosphate-sugar epimerase
MVGRDLSANKFQVKKIGIIGASSQVGSSVALYLKKFDDLELTCFIRSSYSKVYFELFNIPFFDVREEGQSEYERKIASMDVVLDFAYPTGQLHDILSSSKENIENTMGLMRPGVLYFYMSSIMAYGMPNNEKWIANYRIPRNSYSYIKRAIEKFTVKVGKKKGLQVYNFRLGQVHGFLQSVNHSFCEKLANNNIALLDGEPSDKVNVIFIHSLCEAINQCLKGVHPPGLYTLVAQPQWSLQDLYGYYSAYYNIPVHLEFKPAAAKKQGKKSLVNFAMGLARPYRNILETYLLMKLPKLAVKIKGTYRQNEFLKGADPRDDKEYIDFNLLGSPPLKMMDGLTVALDETMKIEKEMEAYYNAIIEGAYKK